MFGYVNVETLDAFTQILYHDRLKHLTSHDEDSNYLYSPRNAMVFSQMQKSCPSALAKRLQRFLWECIVNLLKGNLRTKKDDTRQDFRTNFDCYSQKLEIGTE